MKFGVCKSLDNAQLIKGAGYDYIEANLKTIAQMTDAEFEKQLEFLKSADLPCESSNCFFPNEFLLVGDNVDFEKIEEYADLALSRASRLGIKVAVLGSGRSRNVPDGFDRQKAVEQFKRVITICADAARKYGIKIALEPLNDSETNLLNTVGEAYELCCELEDSAVGIVADLYHLFRMNEDVSVLSRARDCILHMHIARPNMDRRVPSTADAETLKIWADAIKKSGYNDRLSLECSSGDSFVDDLNSMAEVKYIFN